MPNFFPRAPNDHRQGGIGGVRGAEGVRGRGFSVVGNTAHPTRRTMSRGKPKEQRSFTPYVQGHAGPG